MMSNFWQADFTLGERTYRTVEQAPLSRKWTLVTDHHADSDSVAAFTASGIEVVIVDHEGFPVR